MQPTTEMLNSVPFQYAQSVRNGEIVVGSKIKKAVERFYRWIEDAEKDGFTLNHKKGMRIIEFFPAFLNHTTGKMAGQPFHLMPFQQFTMYNLFGWEDKNGIRRINTVYDKRAKKNGKTAEMAGLALYCMSFDMEMAAQVFVGATKEEQARLCWNQAKMFIDSPVANPSLSQLGFKCFQRIIRFEKTQSEMRPLGGDSKTQDGINSHLSIIDEYHAHKDDSVKENLESSSVNRSQPITYHITTAGVNLASFCKLYEDSVIEVLEGRKRDDHLWIMIHDLDDGDDWENEENWAKANPLLGQGLAIDNIRKEYIKAVNQFSKIPNFKTKHLNMWVDAPEIWIPNEIWMKNKVDEIPLDKFKQFGSIAAVDLSTTTDITAYVILSEPDENECRYVLPFFFVPKDTIEQRSKEDRVPYDFWHREGYIIATPGNVIDYEYIKKKINETYFDLKVKRVEFDKWNATQLATELSESGIEVSYFSQAIGVISFPTKEFEKLVYEGKILHDGNPVLAWMLSGCVIYKDANENIKVHKGQSNKNGKRIDGIVAIITALGGSLTPEEDEKEYKTDQGEIYI